MSPLPGSIKTLYNVLLEPITAKLYTRNPFKGLRKAPTTVEFAPTVFSAVVTASDIETRISERNAWPIVDCRGIEPEIFFSCCGFPVILAVPSEGEVVVVFSCAMIGTELWINPTKTPARAMPRTVSILIERLNSLFIAFPLDFPHLNVDKYVLSSGQICPYGIEELTARGRSKSSD
jgi:hypothetical protein